MRLTRTLLIALAGLVAACATTDRYGAAGDIHDFLVAVRDGDRATFDAHVDRAALKTNLRARVLADLAGRYAVGSRETLGGLVAGPLVDVAVDALVRPEVFRAAAELEGYGPDTHIPGSLVLGQRVRPLDSGRVCAVIQDRCSFVFKNEDGTWRLIDFQGDFGLLKRPARRA